MSEQLLTLFKFGLLAVLYVFFLRVLWAVWSEIKGTPLPANSATAAPSSTVSRSGAGFAAAAAGGAVAERSAAPAPSAPAPSAPAAPAASPPVLPDAVPQFGGYDDGYGSGYPAPGVDTVPTASGRLVGREPAEVAGVQYQLDNEITVGRAAGCSIYIDDTFVSQLHARIFRTTDGYYVEDLGSTNGSFHNGSRLAAQQPQPLEVGDYVQFGSTVLEFA